MKIYVVGSSRDKFLPLDNIREKFLIDQKHEGDNIDFLNPWYCELTGMYYMWKHCNDDIVGLEHYRRYFVNKNNQLLNENEIRTILETNDVIMYRYVGCNSMTHMRGARKSKEFALSLALLNAKYGEKMSKFFYNNFTGNYVYLGNMFICKKEIADKFFEFIFDLLDSFDKEHKFQTSRIDGYICEYFMEPWFEYNGYKIYNCERNVYNKEFNQKLPNWA